MTAYQQIVGLLSQLSADELAALEKRIKSLRALSGNAVSQPSSSPDEDTEFFVLSCASGFMQSMGADPCATMPMLRRSVGPAFRDKLPGLIRYLRDNAHLRVTQKALLSLGFKHLYIDMVQGGYTVTTRTLLAHIHRIPAVLEQNYPGYRQAGALEWTVSSHSPSKRT